MPNILFKMERETRFELATSTLATWGSTTELLPHIEPFYQVTIGETRDTNYQMSEFHSE